MGRTARTYHTLEPHHFFAVLAYSRVAGTGRAGRGSDVMKGMMLEWLVCVRSFFCFLRETRGEPGLGFFSG